ncbi:hypothetical protein G7K_0220-t1 [Saitoella complicata NRRL Y-17804]|uniref:Uncharacterized protein n=1 Tax=Saitoella complicata (strain BCRC 22490 / CBS 7301 / JCM 7358 / NBRC 10748 / NRRL Y-17804) TaxID=698492 RepID=A0A0E9N994_SAICN|nr:hypothetical protein G7K_0220-t1 [Saitoella complicata NRRL Y-17804]
MHFTSSFLYLFTPTPSIRRAISLLQILGHLVNLHLADPQHRVRLLVLNGMNVPTSPFRLLDKNQGSLRVFHNSRLNRKQPLINHVLMVLQGRPQRVVARTNLGDAGQFEGRPEWRILETVNSDGVTLGEEVWTVVDVDGHVVRWLRTEKTDCLGKGLGLCWWSSGGRDCWWD